MSFPGPSSGFSLGKARYISPSENSEAEEDRTPTSPIKLSSTYTTAPSTPYWNSGPCSADPIALMKRLAEEVDKMKRRTLREYRTLFAESGACQGQMGLIRMEIEESADRVIRENDRRLNEVENNIINVIGTITLAPPQGP